MLLQVRLDCVVLSGSALCWLLVARWANDRAVNEW